jgi:hypothetical protein
VDGTYLWEFAANQVFSQVRSTLWRTYSYVPHPDSSGCLAIPDPWRPHGSTACRSRGVPKSRDAARRVRAPRIPASRRVRSRAHNPGKKFGRR